MASTPSAEDDYTTETAKEIHFYGDWTGGYTDHQAEADDGTPCPYRAPELEAGQ